MRFPKPPLPRFLIALTLPFALLSAWLSRKSIGAELADARKMWRGEWI